MLAGLELVADEVLQGVGLEGSSELTVLDFLSKQKGVNLVVVPFIIFEAHCHQGLVLP